MRSVVICLFLYLSAAESLVSNETKVLEPVTTQASETTRGDSAKLKNKVSTKNLTNTNTVYLEDVLYNLKNQRWKSGQDRCRNQTLLMLAGLQNFSLWAVWEWDSISSEPMGLLYGTTLQLGNFDECLNTPWRSTRPELMTQYCLTNIVLAEHDHKKGKPTDGVMDPYSSTLDYLHHNRRYGSQINELTWGVCVPASCDTESVERLMGIMLARSHLGVTGIVPQISVIGNCQSNVQNTDYDGLFYGFITMAGILFTICVVCTILNSYNTTEKPSWSSTVVSSFCLRRNGRDLLKTTSGGGTGGDVLYGIRAITMYFIVFDHLMGMRNVGPVSDGIDLDNRSKSWLGKFMLHNDLFVDTYFFLSAYLLMGGLLKHTDPSNKTYFNPILLVVKRYFRLIVCVAVVIFYLAAVFPFAGSGPLWPLAVQAETEPCRRNWWVNLLMLNNYLNAEDSCNMISWYIPCDFHYFVVTVALFWLYKQTPLLSVLLAAAAGVIGFVLPGVINYIYGFPPVQEFDRTFMLNPRGSMQFNMTYMPTHMRVGSYFVGLLASVFYNVYAKPQGQKLSKLWATIGACAGLTIMSAVMLTGNSFLNRDYHPLEGAVYACLQRPVWAFGLGVMVICCSLGDVPIIKSSLSWFPWVPLSRLSYGLYLTHSILIAQVTLVARNPNHTDLALLLNQLAGLIFWGLISSLAIWLFAEAPINNLVVALMQPRHKVSEANPKASNEEEAKNSKIHTIIIDVKSGNQDNSHNNNVKISSKI